MPHVKYSKVTPIKALLGRITGDGHILQPLPLQGLPVPLDHNIIRPNGSGVKLQTQVIIHSDKQISFSSPSPPSSHASSLIMDALCPAPKVQGTLAEQLAVAGREEVRGEEDKRIGPHQEGVFYTPPPVIVEMTLHMCI